MIRRATRRSSVRIDDGRTDRHVTSLVTGLRYKKTAPMGFHSAQITLSIDPREFRDLGAGDKVYVYSPTGRTRWEGFIDNPGSLDGSEGKSLELTAMGTGIITEDQQRAAVYIDRDLGQWYEGGSSTPLVAANKQTGPDPKGVAGDGILCQFPAGNPVATGSDALMNYALPAGLEWGALALTVKSGKIDSGYWHRLLYIGTTTGSVPVAYTNRIDTAVAPRDYYVAETPTGHPPIGVRTIGLYLERSGGATNVVDDNTWSFFYDVSVLQRRMKRDGTLVTGLAGMVTDKYVRADWVVEDLVGRVLGSLLDPTAVTIAATTWQIDQLAYHDGATAAQILDDLALFEPDMLWEVLESTSRGYRFNYRPWPTAVRYEISTRDGFDAPGSDDDLCNRVTVKWVDSTGKSRITVRTATSAQYPALSALEEQGRVKDAEPVTLPDGKGSLANAERAGDMALAAKADPPKSANATVARPILDLLTGAWVEPRDIEPGYLVRVRETGDELRLTEVDVDDLANTADLQLGTPILTEEQRFVRLANVAAAR